MIRIKTVDKQNLLNVCKLTTIQDRMPMAAEGHLCCNAFFIAEAKYHPEMYPNAIYQNNVPIGFFLYQRTEQQPDTATICRFMLDDRFRKKEIETAAFAHILRGLKIQGVKKVIFLAGNGNEHAKNLCLSFDFHFTGEMDQAGFHYQLEL